MIQRLAAILCVMAGLAATPAASAEPPPPAEGVIRVATFNVALNRRNAGELVQEFRLGGSPQIDAVAEIIQRVRPDVILINEIDHDARGVSAELFRDTLREGRGGAQGMDFPNLYTAPSNTGVSSGLDLNRDGEVGGPQDAFGFGFFPGQFGMAVLSRLPLGEARTFQKLLWADMPGHVIPMEHYGDVAAALRLSSKSHWDLPVITPDGRTLHLLASHPTPPVFDGPEDANGRRNHDEIRFWVDYVLGRDWMTDDAGTPGAMPEGARWVVLGDLNADPFDGAAMRGALLSLLNLAQDPAPTSPGAAEAAELGANRRHDGPAQMDTADWRDDPGPGNLRVDYVLPSPDWEVVASGVFWPAKDDPLHRLVGEGGEVSSDHRLVWVDLK